MAMLPIAEGERWAFRKAKGPLQEVIILKAASQSGTKRVLIQFEDGDLEGQTEWVARQMLKVPWIDRQAFLEHEHRWVELRQVGNSILKTDLDAAQVVLGETFDSDVAAPGWGPCSSSSCSPACAAAK